MRLFRARTGALVMSALLALYLAFAIWYAITLMRTGQPIAVAIGVALLVLPLIGIWALVIELSFAVRAERLGARLDAEGGMPEERLSVLPSGRVDPAAADAVFPRYQRQVEDSPEDWRAWYRLALAYDACGDRRRARWATRESIRFARAGTPA